MTYNTNALTHSYLIIIYGWFSDNFNFYCIICLYFGISNLKIYPVYTNSFKYIFPDLNTNNAQFGIFTSFWRLFCTTSEDEMSSPSHTCICLQILNWLSYLHTNTAQMLQTWQYKSHPKKKNSMHRLNWNIQHSFQNFLKKIDECDNFSLWYKYLHFIDFIVNANYCNYSWKNTTKQQITK